MTTIITRLYPDTATAQAAVNDLLSRGHSDDYINLISREGIGGVAERMLSARVNARSAAAYAGAVAEGNALVVVQAPFNPMGAARHAMKVLDRHPSLKIGVADENEYIREEPRVELRGSILRDHPRFMSHDMAARERGTVSSAFGVATLSPQKTRSSALRGGGYMSKMLLPFPLLAPARAKTSASMGDWQLSRMFGIPTISRR